jgi:23S rRNA G2069 N7-methylase RlmK/C1962 C5-methylase RlmI
MNKTAAQAELFYNRLVKRHRHLRKWARRIETNAYRIYDRDIPEIPLVLDIYGGCIAGALYKRPYEKDEAEEELWLDAMKKVVSQALEIPEDKIFMKTRQRQRGKSQYGKLGKSNFWSDIGEGNLSFRVNLSDYLDTGLFLDARKKRTLLRREAKGKTVLNLFSYTCTLSVCAAAGEALEVDSVDMSRTYLDWGGVNFKLNGFTPRFMEARDFFKDSNKGNPWKLIRADVLLFLQQAARAGITWDLIVLDPPSFSNSKKMTANLDIRRVYIYLFQSCQKLLKPGGKILFSVNVRSFKLEAEQFPGVRFRNLDEELRDEDFKNRKIPSCWEISLTP